MGCCLCPSDSPSKVDPKFSESDNTMHPSENTREIFVPLKERSCTDILALLIVVALCAGFGILIGFSKGKGDTDRIRYGYDNCLNICGKKNLEPKPKEFEDGCPSKDMTDKTFQLITFGLSGIKSRECVANCTDENHIRILNRCIKHGVQNATSPRTLGGKIEQFINKALSDISVCWREILYTSLIALGTSLAVLIAFRYLIKCIVYIILIGTTIGSICGTIYLWNLYLEEKKRVSENNVSEDDSHTTAYFTYSVAMSVWTSIVLLIIIVMRKRIGLVVQLFNESGKAVYSMPALLFYPIYTYLLVLVIAGCAGYGALWIESAGDIIKKDERLVYQKNTQLNLLRWYNLFMLFIGMGFILGFQHMAIANAVAQWFFTRDKSRLSLPVVRGIYCVTRFHLGTVSFGALIIAIVRIIRTLLAWLQKNLKRCGDNMIVKAILCCCQCCFWCFETVLKFLTNNAYIETAIYGCSFCTAGRKAFTALTNNILRVAAINSVGDFVLFLGKVTIVAFTCVFGICMIEKKGDLNYPWIPITVGGIIAFMIAHCFISVFEMIIDTIFICFCEDCEKNGDGGLYFMSRGLMQYVKDSEKALKVYDKNKELQKH